MNNLHTHFSQVTHLIREAHFDALKAVNTKLISLYWNIGKYISERVADNGWGKSIVTQLAAFILQEAPGTRGFSDKNLWRMKQFYEVYESDPGNLELVHQLSWTHNLLIFSKIQSSDERAFYLNLSIHERLSKRDLERHIDSGYYERIQLANQKLSPPVRVLPQNLSNVFKDTYIFEFLSLPEPYSEKDLRKALLQHLKKFILELGADFIFIGEEFRIQVGKKDFFIDMLFYHRELCCLVPFELKIEEFKPEFIGKMNFYLEALDRDVRKSHENPSIGVLLCKSKDEEIVEYALSRNVSPTLIADYETKFIAKTILQRKLHEMFGVTDLPG